MNVIMNDSPKSHPLIPTACMENKKVIESTTVRQLTLDEDPVPGGFPNLIASKKHQVEQDQHGGRARCKGSMQSTASLWREVPGLQGKQQKGIISTHGWRN
jgi:hypothetical protein